MSLAAGAAAGAGGGSAAGGSAAPNRSSVDSPWRPDDSPNSAE